MCFKSYCCVQFPLNVCESSYVLRACSAYVIILLQQPVHFAARAYR